MLEVHVYQPEADAFEELSSGGRGDGDNNVSATVCDLPNRAFEGLWERLDSISVDELLTHYQICSVLYIQMISNQDY